MKIVADTSYQIDSNDQLSFVDDCWVAFATCAGQANLAKPEDLLGRPIWDFLEDDNVRSIYRSVLKYVRQTGQEVTIPFRCDAPDTIRMMTMTCVPLSDGGVGFVTKTIEEEETEYRSFIAHRVTGTGCLVNMCSWCMAIKLGNGSWVPLAMGIRKSGIFESQAGHRIDHSVCPNCLGSILRRVDPQKGRA